VQIISRAWGASCVADGSRHQQHMKRPRHGESARLAHEGSIAPARTRVGIEMAAGRRQLHGVSLNMVCPIAIFGDVRQPEVERVVLIVHIQDLFAIRRPDRLADIGAGFQKR